MPSVATHYRMHGGLYVLDNVPWFALRVSEGDAVEAAPDGTGYLAMTRVVRKSGNRTIRVILELSDPTRAWSYESTVLVSGIQRRGGEIENMNNKLIGVTVPPTTDLLALGNFIDHSGFQFEYADPTYEDLFPDDASIDINAPEA